jgi:hypothetical protein
MVKCGIKKYDVLPGRVIFTDVDALRYSLSKINNDIEGLNIDKKRILEKLDKAVENYNSEQKRRKMRNHGKKNSNR